MLYKRLREAEMHIRVKDTLNSAGVSREHSSVLLAVAEHNLPPLLCLLLLLLPGWQRRILLSAPLSAADAALLFLLLVHYKVLQVDSRGAGQRSHGFA